MPLLDLFAVQVPGQISTFRILLTSDIFLISKIMKNNLGHNSHKHENANKYLFLRSFQTNFM